VAMTNVVRTMGDLRLVVWVLIVTGGILGFLSVHQQATNAFDNDYGGFAQVSEAQIGADDFDQGGQPRLSGPIGEKNRYAQILVVLLPLGLFRIWGERRPELKITAGVLTLFIALGAMLTFSRGAALGFAIVIVLMTLLRYIRLSQLLAVALAAAVLFVAQPVYFERMLSLAALEGATDTAGASTQEDASIRKRANETIAALLVFADHPVLGVGRGLFPRYYGDYADEVGIISEAEDRQAHNLYTGMAAEVGLFGFLCFIAIFGVTLLDLERVRRRWKVARPDVAQMAIAFSLAVLAYLTTGMFLHLAYERYLWILLALAASAAWIGLHATEPNEAEEVEDQTTAARPPGPVPGKVRRAAKPA